MLKKKHLSSIANHVIQKCSQEIETPVEKLEEDFKAQWNPEKGHYSRKFVEFCSSKALTYMCQNIEEKISDGSFSRFSFDMMLAWQMPRAADEESHLESVAKESEDGKRPLKVAAENEDVSLFYSDIMPLLVNNDPSIGEDSFVWLGSLFPLIADFVNASFTFETLTAPTGHQMFFPAYDKFLKEIHMCVNNLQKQALPKGAEFADDEFILCVDGTALTQRVVRHIGGTSWPGRLTLTNYALYFEASGKLTYEDALKIDLAKNTEHSVKTAATGPWGAPLFDKAIVYESPELSEGILLEFPELTSSTRRDFWLALVKEILLLHQFLSKYEMEYPTQTWEIHSRTILGILRLLAAREMLRISPPAPTKFLIFALYDEIPKGDYVLEQLADSIKKVDTKHSLSASSILRNINMPHSIVMSEEVKASDMSDEGKVVTAKDEVLEDIVNQAREEAKEVEIAKATTDKLKEEGIAESAQVLMELLSPAGKLLPWFQEVISWERPSVTFTVIASTVIICYKEWIGKAVAAFLLWALTKAIQGRRQKNTVKRNEIVVCTASDKSTMESIISAQYGLISLHEIMQAANVTLLKCRSLFEYRSPRHSNTMMMAMSGIAIFIALIPFKLIIISAVCYFFITQSKLGRYFENKQGNRRQREWWDSIPVVPVRIVDKVPNHPT
ncbi:hypothetical protein ACFE04_027408 [Oxalis oulophora]